MVVYETHVPVEWWQRRSNLNLVQHSSLLTNFPGGAATSNDDGEDDDEEELEEEKGEHLAFFLPVRANAAGTTNAGLLST